MGWKNRIVGYRVVKASELKAHPQNWRKHPQGQVDALKAVLDEVGWIAPAIFNTRTGRLLDGHLRDKLALAHDDTEIPVIDVDISEGEEPLVLATFDPISAMAEPDYILHAQILEQIETDNAVLQGMLGLDYELPTDDEWWAGLGDDQHEDYVPVLGKGDVPDTAWPSDNEWEIPLLLKEWQADALDSPVQIWGSIKRTAKMKGTWVFYTEDYRYEAVWNDPASVVNTGPVAVIEPNFSCYRDMPMVVGLYQIFRKRWLARYWQSQGIRIFVDLNVNEKFYEANLLGVPDGWKAWATRGYSDRLDSTVAEYEMAVERAGSADILFVVYGGGAKVRTLCQQKGWYWLPENMDEGKRSVPKVISRGDAGDG